MTRAAVTVLALVAALAGTSPAVASSHGGAQEVIGEQSDCVATAVPAEEGHGNIVISTVPRWTGVAVEIDGSTHFTDDIGCLVVPVSIGEHRVEVVSTESTKLRQELDGFVRSLRGAWPQPVIVETGGLKLEVKVGPPVCELLRPQRLPGRSLFGQDDNRSLLAISTVPRTEGVTASIDGHEMFSDEHGCLTVELGYGTYELAVPDVYEFDESTRFVFGRWDDIWDSVREITIGPGDRELDLGVKIQHPVEVEFFDAALEPFDINRVQTATLVNSFGETIKLSEQALEEDEAVSFDSVWLPKNRLRRVSGGLQSDDNIYVLREVWVDGRNVVQSGEVDYIPELATDCPDLGSDDPQRCDNFRVRLLLFPFQVELRNFIFRQPVSADVAVYPLNAPDGVPPVLASQTSADGVVVWPQVPRGDYEIRVTGGGVGTTTPTIVTGPKVEQITVMTRDVIWFVGPMLVLMVLTVVFFVRKPRWRLGLAAIWPIVIGFVLSVPSLGAALNRPLSSSVTATYTAAGEFTGIDATVRNSGPVPVDQTYCAPDFELRVPHGDGIWSATYESPDFHDVEMSRMCRLHRVDPGSSRELFTSTAGQEWNLTGPLPPPGVYEAFVKVFDIPAGALDIDLRNGLAPYLTFAADEVEKVEEIPFTNPFED